MEDPDFIWSAWASEDPDPDTQVLGYLRVVSANGYGQARVFGVVRGISFHTEDNEGATERCIREFVLENMYDVARRAIAAQAAAMDFALEMPVKAPEIELSRIRSQPAEARAAS